MNNLTQEDVLLGLTHHTSYFESASFELVSANSKPSHIPLIQVYANEQDEQLQHGSIRIIV